MWVRRADYDAMMARALEANGAKEVLERQVASQKTTMDWMVMRLTQLEHERAQLLYRYMDVKITVPQVELDTPPVAEPSTIGNDLPSFDDVGDEVAKEQGLGWDEFGRATQHGKVIGG